MTNAKTSRRALVCSVIALMLCFAMLVGTTFAWFTDEVTSGGNIIKSGTLDVDFQYTTDNQTWNDASQGAIFSYDHWEPGYVMTRGVKIANIGNLALKFQLNIVPSVIDESAEYALEDVIDVYISEDPITSRDNLGTKVGTLASLMADADGAAYGVLLPEASVRAANVYTSDDTDLATEETLYIALKMQEEAGNEYQDLSVGNGGFAVKLYATQYTDEIDSFDHMYDDKAEYASSTPLADVTAIPEERLGIDATWGIGGADVSLVLDTGYQFLPTETYDEAQESPYEYWHADFVVSASENVPANAVALAGFYSAWCDGYNDGKWVALTNDGTEIPAGQEVRLVEAMSDGKITVSYKEICNYGNDDSLPAEKQGFLCGLADLTDGGLAGTTVTVELRLYECENADSDSGSHINEISPDDYVVAGIYTYTFK